MNTPGKSCMSDVLLQSTVLRAPSEADDDVTLFRITQATSAIFSDLYVRQTFLFFIQSGSKRVLTSSGDLIGAEGDLLLFPARAMVTLENRPILSRHYHGVGVSFPDAWVSSVFGLNPTATQSHQIVRVPSQPDCPGDILKILLATHRDRSLPSALRRHRLLEPLIWLREKGYQLSSAPESTPYDRVRHLIETDLERDWRAGDIAGSLAMSEATMRRWLARSGHSFAKLLLNTRLEHGLTHLQTSNRPITEIALECGFKTPSHFSEAFRKRFGIRPSEIRHRET